MSRNSTTQRDVTWAWRDAHLRTWVGACLGARPTLAKIKRMSALLPNIDDLIAAMPKAVASNDALQLATVAREATTVEELDAVIRATIDGWRQ